MKKEKRGKINIIGVGTLFYIAGSLTVASAQNNLPTTGGNATGSGGSVSYSVGQVFYTTNTGVTGSVAQGVQQPYEISIISAIEEAIRIDITISATPNPTTEFITLKIDASTPLSIQSLIYQLFDIQGKLLETKKIEGNETSIVMSNLIPAVYFLKVMQSEKEIKTFKIIKD